MEGGERRRGSLVLSGPLALSHCFVLCSFMHAAHLMAVEELFPIFLNFFYFLELQENFMEVGGGRKPSCVGLAFPTCSE